MRASLGLVLTMLFAPTLVAQTSSATWGFSAFGGLGPGGPGEFGLAAVAGVRYERVVARLRYATAGEFLGDFREDIGVTLGYALTPVGGRTQASAGIGIGRVSGSLGCVLCGSSPTPRVTGLLLDVDGRWALTSFAGFGGYLFADFNSDQTFYGLTVGVYLGAL